MRAGDRVDTAFSRVDAASSPAFRPEDRQPPLEDSEREPCSTRRERNGHVYAALDLGTNNCRLLIARPAPADHGEPGFRVIDSFSRIVRLGEGLSISGRLSSDAIERTIDALDICRQKMLARGVTRARLIATEACRAAQNGADFLRRARLATGLELEIVDRETEAHLAAAGSASLADAAAASVVLFDIGGGSSEIVWLGQGDAPCDKPAEMPLRERVRFWASLKLGVVTLAERFGGLNVSEATFDAMVDHVSGELQDFVAMVQAEQRCGRFHLLGTSGTVTTIAGVFLGLSRYDRRRVDGLWMSSEEVSGAIAALRAMSYDERAMNGCIGAGRADLVLAGCAILEAIRRSFPAERVRIADRGLREGILMQLIDEDMARGAATGRAAG
ncbi:Ppx/GppA phosphatase family protein [Methylocella silvestris]|uniref:Exopolyphosphatase n=1 Tax=Methylocella silvestris TaxID=199596 RepID=A0A2J7TK19_METSI|nr:Ppx/GppA phosphatase family protein [Methylocella silvestris]PNG27114.1 exopolyphosphatase [Methylocella silvestris]